MTWLVTLIDDVAGRPFEVCVQVEADTKDAARKAAKVLHPHGHTIHVERAPGYGG